MSAHIDIDRECKIKMDRRKHSPLYEKDKNKTRLDQWRLLFIFWRNGEEH